MRRAIRFITRNPDLQAATFDADIAAMFTEHGGLTRANGQRYRDLVLSKGHSQDYSVMFRNMTGHDPKVEPLLVKRGLGTASK